MCLLADRPAARTPPGARRPSAAAPAAGREPPRAGNRARWAGAAAAAVLLGTLVLPGAGAGDAGAQEVVRVPVTGEIELGLAPFVERSLDEAAARGARAAILDIDTPGGRIDAAWQIIDAVRDAAVPVYAWVNRRALSAGAMIALSADSLFMRPGSTIGAATPVTGGGQKASEKMVSAMRSEFRALAEQRGFDPRVAEAMVDEEVAVEGVVERGELLTLTTEEALELGVADGSADGLAGLLADLDLAGARILDTRPNWAEGLVRFLTSPMVAPLLLSLGFLGLLIEIQTPTFGIAGGLGLLCLAAFFGARFLVQLAGLEEILLFSAGLVLIAVEVFVVPGFGVPGGLGLVALLAAVFMSLLGRFPTTSDMWNAAGTIATALLIVGVVGFLLVRHLPRSERLAGILLRSDTGRDAGYTSATPRADLVGEVGTAVTDLRPAGTMVLGDERIDVVTEGPWIEAGTRVRVLRAEGYRHVVREAPGEAEDRGPGDGGTGRGEAEGRESRNQDSGQRETT